MRIALIGLVVIALLVAAVPMALLITGTVDTTSVDMALNVMFGTSGPRAEAERVQREYSVPEGFEVSLYAEDVPRARFLHFSSAGDLLVSRPHAGDIVLLRRDADGDGRHDGMTSLLENLRRPLGLEVVGEWLYIAESNQIVRVRFNAADGAVIGPPEPLVEGLTDNGNHWSKTLRFGPDGLLYLSQGSTCNVCEEEDSRRGTMMRFQADGSDAEVFATGLRNSAGFDWAPWDGQLYATENGRDLLGDDFPPCELNLLEQGAFYGWPYFNGANVPDPDMGPDPRVGGPPARPPVHAFAAHNAPLGMRFLDTEGWPRAFERSAVVALHGSWNRSQPDGYKVVSLHFRDGGIEERDFLWGFNRNGGIGGRPVDVAQGPDGAVYVSDDYAGAIYRVSYTGTGPGQL